MARTHARTKGKSGSSRPVKVDLSFVSIKPKEIIEIILKLTKDDIKPSQIGSILRDTHGVPSVKAVVGKSITTILEENKVLNPVPEDLAALVVTANRLKKHLSTNTRDTHNKRSILLTEAKIRRLAKYYKKNDKLPSNWSYN